MGKITDLTPEGKEELVVSLATLICADAKVDVTVFYCILILIQEDNLKKLVSGSNNKVAAYWTQMFAKLSAGHDLLKAIGGTPGVAVAVAGAAAGGI